MGAQKSEMSGPVSLVRITCLAVLLPLAALGCASLSPSAGSVARHGSSSSSTARPDASPEYDVLVGSLAALEGDLEEARAAFARAALKDPESAFLERVLGRIAAQLDDLDAALAHGERAVQLEPEDSEARRFLGRLYRIQRDVSGAEKALLDEDGRPFSPEAGLLLYQVYLESNRLEDALAVAVDLVARAPEQLGGHMAAATVYERMGRPAEAESALRAALEFHAGRFVLFSRIARLRRATGDREGEIEVYREVLATHPDHYGTLVSLAEALIAIEDLEAAVATYAAILEYYPDDHQSVRRLATLEFIAGRQAEAAVRLQRALAREPEQYQFAYALGQVWRGMEDDQAAISVFRSIPPEHPSHIDARLQVVEILEDAGDYAGALAEIEAVRLIKPDRNLAFHAAALRSQAGDFEGGVALLQQMLAEDPEDDEVLYQLGVLYGMAKKVDEAIRFMHETLAKNPENAHALNYLGYTWAERGEKLDEAEAMILRALELRPNDGYITDSLGWVYYMRARPLIGTGRLKDAMALLERAREHLFLASELTGGDPVVSEHLGDVHVLLDQKERALGFYEEAVSLEPREEEQPDLVDKLEELRQELEAR